MAFHELLRAGEWPGLDLHNQIGAQLEAARQQEHSKAPAEAPAEAPAVSQTRVIAAEGLLHALEGALTSK